MTDRRGFHDVAWSGELLTWKCSDVDGEHDLLRSHEDATKSLDAHRCNFQTPCSFPFYMFKKVKQFNISCSKCLDNKFTWCSFHSVLNCEDQMSWTEILHRLWVAPGYPKFKTTWFLRCNENWGNASPSNPRTPCVGSHTYFKFENAHFRVKIHFKANGKWVYPFAYIRNAFCNELECKP